MKQQGISTTARLNAMYEEIKKLSAQRDELLRTVNALRVERDELLLRLDAAEHLACTITAQHEG